MNKSIIIIRSNPINPDSRVEKEANSLISANFKVTLLGWDRSKNFKNKTSTKKLFSNECELVHISIKSSFGSGIKNIFPLIYFQIKLFLYLIRNNRRFEIIHACDFDSALTSFIFTKLFKKKFIFDIFDYLYTKPTKPFILFKKIIKKIQDFLITKADGVILCTEERFNQIGVNSQKRITIIHNSPIQVFEKISFYPSNKKIKVVYIGIFQDHRMILELLDYFSTNDLYEFHIGGFGKYEKKVLDYSIKFSNIIYYGKTDYITTLNIESCCDIMLAIYDPRISDHKYAAPNKFYEALMLGKPLIMVKDTGMSINLNRFNIGELIDYNINSFDLGLTKIVSRRNEWNNIKLLMQDLYKSKYSWQIMEKRLIDFYKNIN